MMSFKDYFLNKITEILGTFFVLFIMLEFLYRCWGQKSL